MTDQQFLDWCNTPGVVRLVLVEAVASIAGVDTTIYLSSKPYVTGSGDTPANISYDPCIIDGVEFNASIDLGGDTSISFGDIEVDNTTGSKDGWLGYVWANRAVNIFLGDPRWVRSDFRQVFSGVVSDLASRDRKSLNLKLKDKLERLNSPLTETKLGGSTANKDKLLPICVGECFNVTPLLIDPVNLTYQLHQGQIESVIEVRSNGAVPVSNSQNLLAGTFTLSASPNGAAITASVQGAKPSGVYSNDVASLVKLIVTTYGPTTTRLSTSDLDLANFTAFTAANPQPVGLYAEERMNVLEACQQLCKSIGAAMTETSLGLLRLVKLTLPATGTPTLVTADDIIYHTLQIEDRPPVKSTCKLGYAKNWTPQDPTALAAGIAPSTVPLFKEEWLTVTSADATVNSAYLLNQEPVQEDSLLLAAADASTEADRRRDLWKVPRTVFAMECRPTMLLVELGDTVTITHSRFGLSGGVTGLVVGVQRNWLTGRVKLRVLV